MGRLWVQGPSNNDIAIHFKTDLKDAQEFLNKIDKIRLENDGQELDNGKVDEESSNNNNTNGINFVDDFHVGNEFGDIDFEHHYSQDHHQQQQKNDNNNGNTNLDSFIDFEN